MSEWQPIESAPLDEPVLVWDGQVTVAKQTHYKHGNRWWVWDTYGFCEDGEIYEPSHWMPLPSPPTS